MTVRIVLDNRVRLSARDVPEGARSVLRSEFTYSNPQYHKLKAIKKPVWNVPKRISTWGEEGEGAARQLTFPRGGFRRVRRVLEGEGLDWEFADERSEGSEEFVAEYLAPFGEVAEYQERARDALLARENALLRAPTGCLAGETLIELNRAGKSFKLRIDEVVHRFNGGKPRRRNRGGSMGHDEKVWRADIPTRVRSQAEDGTIRLHALAAAYESGVQKVYEVEVESGRKIRATVDHRFMTSVGWLRLGELAVGAMLCVDGGVPPSASRFKSMTGRAVLEKIVRIEEGGEEATYDLAMEGEPRNFLANGFVVHNSRKTSIGMMVAAAMRVPTLILVDTGALLRQWVERIGTELGVEEDRVGLLGGGKMRLRPITVGMPATVVSRFKKPALKRQIEGYFGAVVVDEVHGAAARRLFEAVDALPARYRFGLSADERRQDRMEFLVYDLFGEVAYDIDREDLVQRGYILDVEIRVVPTEFRADWYGRSGEEPGDLAEEGVVAEEKEIDFVRLVDEMRRDAAREAILVDAVAGEVSAGSQVLVLAHRRDHCRAIDGAMAARSIPAGFLIGGEDYARQFDETKAGLLEGRTRVGIGTMKSIGQAIDIPRVGVGVIATPLAGNRTKFNQARGRFCRIAEGKTGARLYYLWDRNVYPDHLANLVRWNPTVAVRGERGEWVEGNEHLRRERERRAEDEHGDP